jgi:hypothetical protein
MSLLCLFLFRSSFLSSSFPLFCFPKNFNFVSLHLSVSPTYLSFFLVFAIPTLCIPLCTWTRDLSYLRHWGTQRIYCTYFLIFSFKRTFWPKSCMLTHCMTGRKPVSGRGFCLLFFPGFIFRSPMASIKLFSEFGPWLQNTLQENKAIHESSIFEIREWKVVNGNLKKSKGYKCNKWVWKKVSRKLSILRKTKNQRIVRRKKIIRK